MEKHEKFKKGLAYLGADLGSGFLASLLSVFYQRDLTRGLGAYVHAYGFPLSWIKKTVIVYPGEPTFYCCYPENLVIDFIFWSSVVATIGGSYLLYKWYRSRKSSKI